MKKTLLLLSIAALSLFAEVDTTKPLSKMVIEGDNGGYYNGKAWDSEMLKGKTTMLMYVDPDEKGKGEPFKPTIEGFERDLDFDTFQILVIINLNATWKPDALIKKMMKSKVDTYNKRTYILDAKSVLVKGWGLPDDEYNTLIIDKEGKVIYQHAGDWDDQQMKEVDTLVRHNVQ
jgi:hypothetical protein